MSVESKNPYQSPSFVDPVIPSIQGKPLGGRGTRLLARIVDNILSTVILFAIMFAVGMGSPIDSQSFVNLIGLVGISIGIYLVLHGYLLAKRGQTVGKMLLKLRIVDRQSEQILPLGKVFGLRELPIFVASAIPFVGGLLALVDALFIFSEDRRCIHDRIADTKVIEA